MAASDVAAEATCIALVVALLVLAMVSVPATLPLGGASASDLSAAATSDPWRFIQILAGFLSVAALALRQLLPHGGLHSRGGGYGGGFGGGGGGDGGGVLGDPAGRTDPTGCDRLARPILGLAVLFQVVRHARLLLVPWLGPMVLCFRTSSSRPSGSRRSLPCRARVRRDARHLDDAPRLRRRRLSDRLEGMPYMMLMLADWG